MLQTWLEKLTRLGDFRFHLRGTRLYRLASMALLPFSISQQAIRKHK